MKKTSRENPTINNPRKMGSGTSFPQEAFYYYIKQIDKTAINRDEIGGEEVDIYIPSLNVGIEYDGVYFHSSKRAHEKELRKNRILKKYGLNLIRVKEQKGEYNEILFSEIDGVPTFTYSIGRSYKYLESIIVRVLTYIFGEVSIFVNPLDNEHKHAILESYRQNLSEMSLEVKYPDIAKEWHPTKNGLLKPSEIYPGSGHKVWWICEEGHEWKAKVYHRTSGVGCPYCAGQRVIPGVTDLQTKNPELAKEWHPTKNGNLKPIDIAPSSGKKVWWKCKQGHEWEATINSRAGGRGCPICSGKKVVTGFNDLQTINPNLTKEWHPTKNRNIKPSEVPPSSDKKVWWLCKHGHEWEATINSRASGNGCPYCSGNKVLVGFNDLQTINPELAKEWHPTKNGNLKPTQVTPGSNKKVWWICKEGHEWEATVSNRKQGCGCPYCTGNKVLIGFNDLQTINPELAKEWHPTKNGNLKPTQVTLGSTKKVWWICKEGHEWEATINSRTIGSGCPYCTGNKVLMGFNDLQIKYPELAKEWHPTKNGNLKPTQVTPGSNKKVWWICKQGHEWEAIINSRTMGSGCPYCAGKKVLVGFNDLQTKYPEVAKQWHPTKNGDLKPTQVTQGSHRKVWWICEHEHEWQAIVKSRTRGNGCPECRKLKRKKNKEI